MTEQVRTLDAALHDTIPALLALLDALPEDSPFLQLDAPQRRQRTLAALKLVLLRQSQVQPLLLVCEDLHWLDTETQALLESLSESLPTARLLLLVNYRPDYRHGWGSKTYYTQVRLDPLPPARPDAFLRALLGDDPSLTPLTQLLIQRTEGNPFFLEESVRTLVETGSPGGRARGLSRGTGPPNPSGAGHRAGVLAARIDRLPPEEKRLLQTAAVMGTEVPLTLLQAVVELPEEALRLSLTHLQDAEFLYEASLFPELVYTFKHALTQEVAYGSLLQEQRRMLHARIVEAIEALYADRVVEQVERLAYHAQRGRCGTRPSPTVARRVPRRLRAPPSARRRPPLSRRWRPLGTSPRAATRASRKSTSGLTSALCSRSLGEHERLFAHLQQAETLAEALGDQRRLGQVSAYMGWYFWGRGDYDRAIASCQRALALAETLGDGTLRVMPQYVLGTAYHALGDYHRAIDL